MPASIGFYGLPEDAMNMEERVLAIELDRMNSQSASRRPATNRRKCLKLFSDGAAYMKYQLERHGCTVTRKNTMITSDHCCTKALEDLKPIFLKQMKVPYVHAGRYLLCRTITETTRVAIEFIVYVEDSEGDLELITFYNFTSDFSNTSWLPNGSLLLIKEPVLKYVNVNNQASIILDSPSDVIFVDETDLSMKQFAGDSVPWFKADKLSFEENKTKGNQLFGIKDYEGALKFYQRALCLQPGSPVISLNRAAALLKLERFYEAYQEAELALNGGCNREKALFRLGKAAYGMRDYQKAQRHFQTCLQEFPGVESDAPVELALVAKRLQEEAGQVDISSLYDAEEEGNILHLDIADYNTPVAIADIPGKGKGLVATLDVEPGTLLIVSKAFAVTHPVKEQILVQRNKQGVESVYGGTWIRNMINVVETLQKNPHRAKELYSLYADELDRDEEIPPGVVDTARIMKICKNSDRFAKTEKYRKEYTINGKAYLESPHGLWTLPTFMNHSCLGNAHRSFYGDVMVVHATQKVVKGEEITFDYFGPLRSYKERKDLLLEDGVVCKCELCELDSNDPLYEKRERILARNPVDKLRQLFLTQLTALPTAQNTALPMIEQLVNTLRENYRNRSNYRTQLCAPLLLLGDAYMDLNQFEKACHIYSELYPQYGARKHKDSVGAVVLVKLCRCLKKLQHEEESILMMGEALNLLKISEGADGKMFLKKMSKLTSFRTVLQI